MCLRSALLLVAAATCAAGFHLPMQRGSPCSAPRRIRIRLAAQEGTSAEDTIAQLQANINEGELSTRGEGWAIGQAFLLLSVLFAPAQPVVPVVEVTVGVMCIAAGAALVAAAVSDLGLTNLTPWPKPVEGNELRTGGAYALCRHPMYSSLLAICFGLSLLNQSFERLLLTVALFALLSLKAGREEAFLKERHGDAYCDYAQGVKQFFPSAAAVSAYVRGLWGRTE